jgi:hypothetical protein
VSGSWGLDVPVVAGYGRPPPPSAARRRVKSSFVV